MQKKKKELSFSLFGAMFRALFRLTKMAYKESPLLLFWMIFLSVILALSPFLSSWTSGHLVNQLIETQKVGGIVPDFYPALAFYIFASLVLPLFSVFYQYADYTSWFLLEKVLEFKIMRHREKLDISLHEDAEFSNLAQRMSDSVHRVRNFIDRQFQLIQNIVGIIAATAVVYSFNKWAALAVILGTVPQFIFEMKFGTRAWGIHSAKAEVRRKYYEVRSFFYPIRSLVELKLFQTGNFFVEQAESLFDSFRKEVKKKERDRLVYSIFSVLFSYGTIAGAIAWFVFDAVAGRIQIGTLIFVFGSLAALRANFSGFLIQIAHQYEDGLFVLDVLKFLDTPPRIIVPQNAFVLDSKKTPEIVFENVSFKYPGSESFALKNFSLRIPVGEKLAIIGLNGAGKTTFVKLLCRFYDPDEGRILIGGKDLKEIDLNSWYAHIGALFQEYMNYGAFTVTEAIAFGDTKAKISAKRAREAAQASQADDFINRFPLKYKQVLGKMFDNGVSPSTGQWQKIALARVFYRNPNVFILDEPTASIDADAEAKIFEKMESLSSDKTVIFISHRFSTVRNANKIIVIKEGVLAEEGTHLELLRNKKLYAELFRLQAKGYQ